MAIEIINKMPSVSTEKRITRDDVLRVYPYAYDGDLISRKEVNRQIDSYCRHFATELPTLYELISDIPSVSAEREYMNEAIKNCYDCEANEVCKMQPQQECIFKIPFRAERVGEWEYDVDADDSFCTNCHKYAIRDMEMQLESDFCPNCGARMENTK